MQFEQLDPQSARAFLAASETLNFTRAGQLAFMTQSGVSQHIARIEEQLGVKLFVRHKRETRLTEAGTALRQYLRASAKAFDSFKQTLAAEDDDPAGVVAYAMPPSCLLSPHFHLLLQERARKFPKVHLKVAVCENAEVLDRLLSERADFGFVTVKTLQPGVSFSAYCFEEYALVGPKGTRVRHVDDVRALPMLRFPGAEAVFDAWMKKRFPKERLSFAELSVVGEINELSGLFGFLREGFGCAVVAKHCVQGLLESKVIFDLDRGKAKVQNAVYLVTRQGQPQTRRVGAVIEAFHHVVAKNRD